MLYTVTLILLLNNLVIGTNSSKGITTNFDRRLSREEYNARCCSRKMKCCQQTGQPTNFEVRALLLPCPRKNRTVFEKPCGERKRKSITRKRHSTFINTNNELKDEKPRCDPDMEVTNCKKKIKLTVKIRNSGLTNCKNQYILIDHVFDALTEQKQKLLFPYVLKIKQQPIIQVYQLDFNSAVNAKAKENVYSKRDAGYTGCNTDPNSPNPTCGKVKYNDQIIPYSTGFCCPCLNPLNPGQSRNIEEFSNSQNYSDYKGSFKEDWQKKTRDLGIPEANKMNGNYINKNDNYYGFSVSGNRPQSETQNMNLESFIVETGLGHKDNKRLSGAENAVHYIQKRGGQDCSDHYTPPNANSNTYHDSTHCLEFSNIWYTVYNVEKPKIYHFLQVQIYEKYQDMENNCKWRDLTKKTPIYMSTEVHHFINEQNTISINYRSREVNENTFALSYKMHKLLVPDLSSLSSPDDITDYPQLRGGPEEYLVVKETEVQPSGKACDVAGVGYEAFSKQPNRCAVPKGSCLKNQPFQMWKHDKEAERNGDLGTYFMKYFGTFPPIPITTNNSLGNNKTTLKMFYTDSHTSILEVEFKADQNIIVRPDTLAVITEVYIDSSSPKKTSIIAKVFNSGLITSIFKVSLSNCPMNLPASFSNINSKPALIPPQHQHIYNLEIQCPLPTKYFYCSLQVTNLKNELVAFRKIRLQRQDRCICIWHCSCACLIRDEGLKCDPLSIDEYHAAGFQGGMQIPLHVVRYTFLDDLISLIVYIFLCLCLTLLVMGLIKALVGICMKGVGLWGLDVVLDLPKEMNQYYENEISVREVIYDKEGWPIHPDTKKRVRNVAIPTEFCINIIFFVIYPVVLLWLLVKRLCFASYPASKMDSFEDTCRCRNGSLVQIRSSGLQVRRS